jgi:hypothetical protein
VSDIARDQVIWTKEYKWYRPFYINYLFGGYVYAVSEKWQKFELNFRGIQLE